MVWNSSFVPGKLWMLDVSFPFSLDDSPPPPVVNLSNFHAVIKTLSRESSKLRRWHFVLFSEGEE